MEVVLQIFFCFVKHHFTIYQRLVSNLQSCLYHSNARNKGIEHHTQLSSKLFK